MSDIQHKLQNALTAHQSGDLATTASLCREILKLEPHQPDALHMLGVIAQQQGNTGLALKLTEAALAIKPDMALAWYNRSLMLRVLGRKDDALQSAEEALHLDPKMADVWDMTALLLRELGRWDQAAQHHERAVQLQPDNVRYRSNYAVLRLAQGDLRGAYKIVRQSESLDRDAASFALGNILRSAGHAEASIPHYQRVQRLMPDSPEAKVNEAMAWLQIGELQKGWDLWKTLPDEKENLKTIPRWQGEATEHLFLHEEQGMGDALQAVRYIPLIRNRAKKITVQINGALQKLLAVNFPDIAIITLDDPVPAAVTARAQLMHLPVLLNTNLDTIPANMPYLKAAQEWREPWRARLDALGKPRIGFVWAGNPLHRNNHNRSLAMQALQPLWPLVRGHGVSLQKWHTKDSESLQAAHLFDADPWMDDFAATAGLMDELDLIITVDTSVAHLAGALSRPVWVLLPFDPDWRWMIGREDSPWYPSMRLFRQNAPQAWDAVILRMADELKKFLSGDASVLIPPPFTGPPLRQNPLALDLDSDA